MGIPDSLKGGCLQARWCFCEEAFTTHELPCPNVPKEPTKMAHDTSNQVAGSRFPSTAENPGEPNQRDGQIGCCYCEHAH